MRWIAFVITVYTSSIAYAESIDFSTEGVLDAYRDGITGDEFIVGYVVGVVAGIVYHNTFSQIQFGNALICKENLDIAPDDVVAMIRGEIVKRDNSSRQRMLKASFAVVALRTIEEAYPCN